MKRAWLILILGLSLGALSYAGVFLACTNRQARLQQSDAPELSWLKEEFHLTPTEFAQLARLHEQYRAGCADRCRRIDQKNAELAKLLASSQAVTPQIEGLLAEAAQLKADCQKTMLRHFFAVSQTMPPEQGQRYLDWVLARTILAETHSTMQH